MAGPAPKTRDWFALENAHKPKGLHVIVGGLVQVTNTNQEPVLTESAERDPQHLGLTLTIETGGGLGLAVQCWKQAHFHKEVKANQFNTVVIRWDVSEIARTPVVDDRERAQHMVQATQALNAKYAKAPKAAPKKAAAKKAAPKKAKKAAPKKTKKKAAAKKAVTARAVKAVGGWAKGVKKALKRVMKTGKKKPAKKAAAKTGGKRKGKNKGKKKR